jgi:hypothetical protein
MIKSVIKGSVIKLKTEQFFATIEEIIKKMSQWN